MITALSTNSQYCRLPTIMLPSATGIFDDKRGMDTVARHSNGVMQILLLGVIVLCSCIGCASGTSVTSGPPKVSAITPTSVEAGSGGFTLTASGTNLNSSCSIKWSFANANLQTLTTAFISSAELQAQVPASDVAQIGFAGVTATCDGSFDSEFLITGFPRTEIEEAANDIAWDPVHQVIYLSVPPTVAGGNAIAVLNPATGQITGSKAIGNNPDVLSVSDDGQFLYAGLDDTSSVQRFTLPQLGTDIDIPVGPGFPFDIQVSPGQARTIAVTVGGQSSPAAIGGVTIFDDANARPNRAPGLQQFGSGIYDSLQWGSGATALYANNTETTSFDFYRMAVDATGITSIQDFPNTFDSFGGLFGTRIHFVPSTGLVYNDDRTVVDPSTGMVVGTFKSPSPFTGPKIGPMVPDGTLNTAFFLWSPSCLFTGVGDCWIIESYNLTNLSFINSITMTQVQGHPINMVQWGKSGLAFNTDTGQVYLVDVSTLLIPPATAQPMLPQSGFLPHFLGRVLTTKPRFRKPAGN